MKLSESTSRDLFAAARSACLGTVDAAGAPHLVPVTFAVAPGGKAGLVYFAVDAKPKSTQRLKRLENIRRHSAVCLLADHYHADWTRLWWARADGAARILAEPERAEPLSLLISRYPQYRQQPPQGPVVAIEVVRWSGWAFSPEAIRPEVGG